MSIAAATVKELRERTGAGMMECKKALVEAAARIRIEHRVEVLTVTLDGTRALADLDPYALLELVGRD